MEVETTTHISRHTHHVTRPGTARKHGLAVASARELRPVREVALVGTGQQQQYWSMSRGSSCISPLRAQRRRKNVIGKDLLLTVAERHDMGKQKSPSLKVCLHTCRTPLSPRDPLEEHHQ
jgi:hypothetical protein